jgi:hypothetical protein
MDIIPCPIFYLKHAVDIIRTSQETHHVSATNPTGLWRWYINIIITIIYIIHRPGLYLIHIMDTVRTSQEAHYVSATSSIG